MPAFKLNVEAYKEVIPDDPGSGWLDMLVAPNKLWAGSNVASAPERSLPLTVTQPYPGAGFYYAMYGDTATINLLRDAGKCVRGFALEGTISFGGIAAPRRKVDDADRAIGLEQPHHRRSQRLGRAGIEQLLREHVPLMAHRGAEQLVDGCRQTVDPRLQPRDDRPRLRQRRADAEQIGHLRRRRRRCLTEERQADRLVDLRGVER